jgi:type IV pilus assembly protein PilO
MAISLSKLPWYAQVGAFVVLAVGGMFAFYYYYEESVDADMLVRQTQLVALKADVTKGHDTARQLPQFRAQVDALQARLESLKNVLPDEKDAADLLRKLQTFATQSNLTIRSFKPAPTVTRQLHQEWPITLELDGTYHNLAGFFDRVGKYTRIININTLDVKGKDTPNPNSTITATCVATTFVLLDKAALSKVKVPPAPGQPAAKGA